MSGTPTRMVKAAALRAAQDAAVEGGAELALVDAREEAAFGGRHLFWAACLPTSRIELTFPALVPRRTAPVVLCDAAGAPDGEAMRAARLLTGHGYANVAVLEGGADAWEGAGFTLYSGVNVPSKAFGEFVEERYGTPSVSAEELAALLRTARPPLVVDSRPFDEYQRMSIPTGIDCPGAELAYRVPALAPEPDRAVIVNCAGRTRSIIGAQSLRNAGLPNHIAALRNGTMGWVLAGLTLEHDRTRRAPEPKGDALARAKLAAARVARRFGVRTIAMGELDAWRRDVTRTLYVLDVRHPEEFSAGHLPGSRSAPGGQLVQATDEFMATRGARVALVDDHGVRATMTASWLIQMGWRDVAVVDGALSAGPLETGEPAPEALGVQDAADAIEPQALKAALDSARATVADLSLSRAYKRGHIPGASFLMRGRLARDLGMLPAAGSLVLTSEDGALAAITTREARALWPSEVCVLRGGNAAWRRAGLPLESGAPRMASPAEDVYLKPYERGEGNTAAMQDYLTWEVELLDKLGRDDEARFRYFPE